MAAVGFAPFHVRRSGNFSTQTNQCECIAANVVPEDILPCQARLQTNATFVSYEKKSNL